MKSNDTFTRRVIATLCAMEAVAIAGDPDYFGHEEEEGVIPVFHGEERGDHTYPSSYAALWREGALHVAIVDQFGGEAGHALIFPDAATFVYSIVTG